MFSNLKRIFAFALVVAMAFAFLPAGAAQAAEYDTVRELTAADYAEADLVFDRIEAAESIHATRNSTQAQITDAAVQIVMASDSYVADSLDRNGDTFSWWTDSGIRCVYSPRMEKISEDFVPENSVDEVVNEPVPVKGGSPTSNQVFLIGPYYGIDSDFTDQYKTEAKRIATAIGDTDGYTLYSGKSATVDKVAQAVSYGAVVLIDTHGSTDYESGYDYVSGATSSYICLNNTSGLTNADYAAGAGYSSDGTAFINGQTIANHMTQNSPSGLVWMASCLGMATNTICNPLRNKGVEVVYGYSQSVTFIGDYVFEDAFWDAFLVDGTTVKQAITAMKNKFGNWDLSPQIATYYGYAASEGYQTISEARNDYAAFPIVVSDEDAHPGQRYRTSNWGADIIQTVKSTYTLGDPPEGPSGSQPNVPDEPAVNGATLSFANIDNRVEFDESIQVWKENGITFTNDATGASNPVADYYNPVRIYAGGSVTIAAKNMYKLDINCSGLADKYVSAWTKTFDAEGISYTNAGGVITVTLDATADSLTLNSMAAQARAYSITVYIDETAEPTTPETEPTVPETEPTVPETEPTIPETEPTVPETEPTVPGATTEIRFEFGENGSAAHVDGSDIGTTKTYTESGYELVLTACSKIYDGAFDAKGNSCLKVGTGSAVGTFTFSVPEDVTEVVIYAAKYKAKNTKLNINGTEYTLSKSSNNGEYEEIVVDTSTTKTVCVKTLSSNTRTMINTIVFKVAAGVEPIPGDLSGDGALSNEDVVALMWHALFPEAYPLDNAVDYDGDGEITNSDVVRLMWYILFPELYPL